MIAIKVVVPDMDDEIVNVYGVNDTTEEGLSAELASRSSSFTPMRPASSTKTRPVKLARQRLHVA